MTGKPTGRCGARSSVTPTLHERLVMRNYNSRTGRQVYKEPAHVPLAAGGPDQFSSAICSPTISLLSHLGTFWFTDPLDSTLKINMLVYKSLPTISNSGTHVSDFEFHLQLLWVALYEYLH